MQQYKEEFIGFMLDSEVLRFGDFVTKSGRNTPFFINAGNFSTGKELSRLGEFYAKSIVESFAEEMKKGFDVLFGPAYKGIPLSVVTAEAYSRLYGKEIKYSSNRKEEKDHGADMGSLLGYKIKDGDKVVMIEDVTTSGKSMEETVPIVRAQGDVEIVGLMVSLNRCEVGLSGDRSKSALDEVRDVYGFETGAIVSMKEVAEYLYNREIDGRVVINDEIMKAIDAYYEQYGVK